MGPQICLHQAFLGGGRWVPGLQAFLPPWAQLLEEHWEVVSTLPAPSRPHTSLPQLQAARGDNEVIFLRNVHLEDSPVCRPAAHPAGKAGPGQREGVGAEGEGGPQ